MLTDRSKLCGLAQKESKAAEAKGKRATQKIVVSSGFSTVVLVGK